LLALTIPGSMPALGQTVQPSPTPAAGPLQDRPTLPQDDGLTLDQAVNRLLRENLWLRAAHDEITMARADIEGAWQAPRGYKLIQVGPDGIKTWSIQPRELIPSRWINVLVARAARRVLEAQYQDAVRQRIDDLYTAFVDVEEAQLSITYHETAVRGTERLSEMVQMLHKSGQVSNASVALAESERERKASNLEEAKTALRKAKLILGNLLNLADAEVDRLKLRTDFDSLSAQTPAAPSAEELIGVALANRPDLCAYRLGLHRAQLDWWRALVEPLNQITVIPLPSRVDLAGAKRPENAPVPSLGMLVSLPTTIRNRGMLDRATINVSQTQTQLADIERKVVLEVRQARLEYEQSRATVDRLGKEIIPRVLRARDDGFRQFAAGEVPMADYWKSQSEYDDTINRYRNSVIHRERSKLALNTAVGARIMR
jgi:cobalt-zinc-cadmium efflux system outer membrane protein